MQPVSTFRGTCGEVVTDYISPLTFVAALPILLVISILWWICTTIGAYGTALYPFLVTVCLTPAVMRFALPASRGTYEPSNNVNEILIYSYRLLLINAYWFVPWLVVWRLWSKSPGKLTLQSLLHVSSLINSPLLLAAQLFLLLIPLVLPATCLLIVLFSSSLKGILSRQYLDWLLIYRRADLSPFMSALLGGSLVMVLISLIPTVLLVAIGTKIFGINVLFTAKFISLWVAATIPVLAGRLAGAFVAHDHLTIEFSQPDQLQISEEKAAPAPQPSEKVVNVRPDVAGIERRISGLSETAVLSSLEQWHADSESPAQSLSARIERLFLLLRGGNQDDIRICATAAIESANQSGFNDVSFALYEKLGSERRKLKLSSQSLEAIGKIYQQRSRFLDAAWCLHAAAVTTGDVIKAQKHLFQMGEAAEKNANLKEAAMLYEIFIKQYPESTFLEFAQQGIKRIKGRPD